jgi:ATP-dependent protease HslVU (ClpYQ) peptidase subunit
MTTIAYKDGIMACDSCWTLGTTVVTQLTKIERLSSGALLGHAGDNDSREVSFFLDKIKLERNLPMRSALRDLRTDFAGLWVLPNGTIFKVTTREDPTSYEDEIGFTRISRRIASCGSGSDIAIGAMAAGKTAREAIKIASEFDVYTRTPIHSMRLREAT